MSKLDQAAETLREARLTIKGLSKGQDAAILEALLQMNIAVDKIEQLEERIKKLEYAGYLLADWMPTLNVFTGFARCSACNLTVEQVGLTEGEKFPHKENCPALVFQQPASGATE